MISIYGTKVCPNCNEIKKFCNEIGVDFTSKDVTDDFRAKAKLIAKGLKNLPVIEYNNTFYECTNVDEMKSKLTEIKNEMN